MAIERKNYLFCGNHRAAKDAAMYYNFFGCCKLAEVNQLEWLTYVHDNINQTKTTKYKNSFPKTGTHPNQKTQKHKKKTPFNVSVFFITTSRLWPNAYRKYLLNDILNIRRKQLLRVTDLKSCYL